MMLALNIAQLKYYLLLSLEIYFKTRIWAIMCENDWTISVFNVDTWDLNNMVDLMFSLQYQFNEA